MVLKLYEVKPDKNDFSNWEVFKTKEFLNGNDEIKKDFYQNLLILIIIMKNNLFH